MVNNKGIIIEGLAKNFKGVPALAELSFSIQPSEMFVIVGPDGAGKSTLLRILAGILPYDRGKISIFGNELPRDSEKIKLLLGYMPQRFGLYEDLTVQENLDFFYSLYCLPRQERRAAYEQVYAFSGLEKFRSRLAGKLSGGMKQKLGLACVLLHKPTLLLLDEPTNGVDPSSRRAFWDILSKFKKAGVTIIVTTPFMDEAERGDRVLLMASGRRLALGKPAEIKELWKDSLYQVHCSNNRQAKAILDESGLTKSIVLFGDRVHFVPISDADIPRIEALLDEQKLLNGKAEKIAPELEDLFISLVTHE